MGKTRRRLAVELIGELEGIDKKIKAIKKDLKALVLARGSTLMDLHGIAASGAARLLADVGDIHRFTDRDRFASWNGTAPLDASSATSNATDSPEAATAGSTGLCTSWPSCSCATASAGRRRGRSMTHPDDRLAGLWQTARHGHEMEQQP